MWSVYEVKDDIHVVPQKEEHILCYTCDCMPTRDPENFRIIMHNSYDNREKEECPTWN